MITAPLRDLFIASTSIVNDCTLVTLNKKHFENIKDLQLLDFWSKNEKTAKIKLSGME